MHDDELPPRTVAPMTQTTPIEDRTPTDGRPYYCKLCGLGLAEYIACELPDCELESEAEAAARAA